MQLAEPTPFSAHAIDCRSVDTTGFAAFASQQSPVWQCELSPSAPLFRASAWEVAFTSLAEGVSAVAEQLQASMATLVTSLRSTELPNWLISDLGSRALDVGEPDADRRLYALAGVHRLQRLLGLSQDQVASLVGVSRPTLWNWQQGRTPQERSLRRLSEVAGVVDLLVDAMGGEDGFDSVVVESQLNLDHALVDVLQTEDGPGAILDRLFERSRESVPTPSLLPTIEDLLAEDESEPAEHTESRPRTAGTRQLRSVSRRG